VNAHTIQTDAGTYVVVDDLAAALEAFIVGLAIDELDGVAPGEAVSVDATLRGITPGTPGGDRRFVLSGGPGGAFAVSGEVGRAFPKLGSTPYTVDLTIRAAGYLPVPLAIDVPAGTSFPLPPVTAHLHRPAIWLAGRVTDDTGVPLGVPAQVTITDPAGLVGLQWPLDFPHAAATQVAPATLTPLGASLALVEPAFALDGSLRLARRLNLGPGALVQLGSGLWREYAVVDHLEGPADLGRPGRAVLRAPLHAGHPAGSEVQPVVPSIASSTGISLGAVPGDQVIVFATATALATGGAVEVADADPTKTEWRVALLPTASTDDQGFYRLGPISRTAAAQLHVTAPAPHKPVDVGWLVDYGQLENVRNVRVQ
jgi:hypothetical protein